MMKSSELAAFLADIRQHPLFPALLGQIEPPRFRPYNPKSGESLEEMGAKQCFVSGQMDQHNKWWFLLTGEECLSKFEKPTTS